MKRVGGARRRAIVWLALLVLAPCDLSAQILVGSAAGVGVAGALVRDGGTEWRLSDGVSYALSLGMPIAFDLTATLSMVRVLNQTARMGGLGDAATTTAYAVTGRRRLPIGAGASRGALNLEAGVGVVRYQFRRLDALLGSGQYSTSAPSAVLGCGLVLRVSRQVDAEVGVRDFVNRYSSSALGAADSLRAAAGQQPVRRRWNHLVSASVGLGLRLELPRIDLWSTEGPSRWSR